MFGGIIEGRSKNSYNGEHSQMNVRGGRARVDLGCFRME